MQINMDILISETEIRKAITRMRNKLRKSSSTIEVAERFLIAYIRSQKGWFKGMRSKYALNILEEDRKERHKNPNKNRLF